MEGSVSLLGIELANKPKWAQLTICGGGFFVGYLVNGLVEEYVYNEIKFAYGWYFSMVHSCYYILFLFLSGFRWKHIQNPWNVYWQMSVVLAGSHGLTKGSLAYLNYPAQLMFKSTKVLPVMMLGAFIPGMKRSYTVQDYVSATLLVVGLILFTLADASSSPIFSVLGVVMVCGALFLDALLGNFQEVIFTINPGTTQTEMLFCSSVLGVFFLAVPCVLIGEFTVAFQRCAENPYVYLVLFGEACATFIGQMSVLTLVILFGAATTALVTTARKAVTLFLSYLVFSKPFTLQHLFGMMLIFIGVGMKMVPSSTASAASGSAPQLLSPKRPQMLPPKRSVEEGTPLLDVQSNESPGKEALNQVEKVM
eukprot:TRINITY_DN1849_c0_g1_i1.p1 TRINITY_DN1849_c0_g1~~TRINITY_DN1849_c0_g1_i1.p1  ORF type:complete len:366 (+),score=58.71 TRINITY_DN1849_c0_g1_i1:388-1485(+)